MRSFRWCLFLLLVVGCHDDRAVDELVSRHNTALTRIEQLENSLFKLHTKVLLNEAHKVYDPVCEAYKDKKGRNHRLYVSIIDTGSEPKAHSFCRQLWDFEGIMDIPVDEAIRTLELLKSCKDRCGATP